MIELRYTNYKNTESPLVQLLALSGVVSVILSVAALSFLGE